MHTDIDERSPSEDEHDAQAALYPREVTTTTNLPPSLDNVCIQ